VAVAARLPVSAAIALNVVYEAADVNPGGGLGRSLPLASAADNANADQGDVTSVTVGEAIDRLESALSEAREVLEPAR
jgi:hypothetical protein